MSKFGSSPNGFQLVRISSSGHSFVYPRRGSLSHTEVVRRAAARATAIGNKTTCGLIIVISRGDHLTRDLTK